MNIDLRNDDDPVGCYGALVCGGWRSTLWTGAIIALPLIIISAAVSVPAAVLGTAASTVILRWRRGLGGATYTAIGGVSGGVWMVILVRMSASAPGAEAGFIQPWLSDPQTWVLHPFVGGAILGWIAAALAWRHVRKAHFPHLGGAETAQAPGE